MESQDSFTVPTKACHTPTRNMLFASSSHMHDIVSQIIELLSRGLVWDCQIALHHILTTNNISVYQQQYWYQSFWRIPSWHDPHVHEDGQGDPWHDLIDVRILLSLR